MLGRKYETCYFKQNKRTLNNLRGSLFYFMQCKRMHREQITHNKDPL